MINILKYFKDRFQGKTYKGVRRSPQWPKVRAEHLKLNPKCAVCDGTKGLEVHHVIPFNQNPQLELEKTNLITLCESRKGGVTCHLFVGHLGSYKRFNHEVREDSEVWNEKLREARALVP